MYKIWDRDNKCLNHVDEIYYDDNGLVSIMIDRLGIREKVRPDNVNYKLLKSSELKDRNGVIIFQGDVVYFLDDIWYIEDRNGDLIVSNYRGRGEFKCLHSHHNEMTVLGSVYEMSRKRLYSLKFGIR